MIQLRQAIDADPSSARAHGDLALALLGLHKKREAVDAARLAAAFGPQLPEARYIYGLALAADGRPVEAAREFEKAVALKPGEIAPSWRWRPPTPPRKTNALPRPTNSSWQCGRAT